MPEIDASRNIAFTLSKLCYEVEMKKFMILILLRQRHRSMPEIDFSWGFLALEHCFSDSAPQILTLWKLHYKV